MNPVVLSLDPAFRNFGWVVMALGPAEETIMDCGVIRTEKEQKKLKILAADDNHRCIGLIVNGLMEVMAKYQPFLICAESQQGSKNAHAMQLQGMAWGALSAIVYTTKVPLLQAGPQQVKKMLTGRRDASKDDIERVVLSRYRGLSELVMGVKPLSLHEHIYDAAAVAITCLGSETVQTVRRMAYQKGMPVL